MKRMMIWILILALGLSGCKSANGSAPLAEASPTIPPAPANAIVLPETTAATEPEPRPVPSLPVPTAPPETVPETVPEPTAVPIPALYQQDYPVPYGSGNVPESGCGVTCLAMVLSALLGEPVSPGDLAAQYGDFHCSAGTDWALFPAAAQDFGVSCTQTFDTYAVMDALEAGKPVICNHFRGLLSADGHFIVLTGLTPQGTITVNDPNRENLENEDLEFFFTYGFDVYDIMGFSLCFWIFE